MKSVGELQMMKLAWWWWSDGKGKVYCSECKTRIQFHPAHVAHILSKRRWNIMRLYLPNMIPLCFDCHDWMDAGKGQLTRKDMKIWPWLDNRIMWLKRRSLNL